jgi:quercetin dioxygenase-like cupin family protein
MRTIKLIAPLLLCMTAFAQERMPGVGGGHIPAHGPAVATDCTAALAGSQPPAAGSLHFPGDENGHPYFPHVDAKDDRWVGHDTCADDPHYHLDHPWEQGRYTGGFGAQHVFTLAVDKVSLPIAEWISVESGRIYSDNYYWIISRYDYDTAARWKWAGDQMAIYEDPVHEGWYLAYNPRLGTFTHIEYLGAGSPPEVATHGPKRLPTFENAQVIMNEPHSKMHTHRFNRVMIYGTKGGEFLHSLDGTTEDLKWEAGQVLWSPATPMHYSEIPTDAEPPKGPRGLDIGLKKPGDPGKSVVRTDLDPLRVDPKEFKLEFENSQVRVLRLKLAPGQSAPLHEYPLNTVFWYYTDQNVRETSTDGKTEVQQHRAGDFVWEDGPRKLKMENLSDKPFEAIVVEVKN